MSTSFQPTHGAAPQAARRFGPTADVVAGVRQRLRASAYRPLHDIECEYHEGIIALRGRVSSYFLKQMAQEAIGKLPGVEEIANHIEVVERADPLEPVRIAEPNASRASDEGQQPIRGSHGHAPR